MADQPNVTYFAETDFRGKKTKFGIKPLDRARHVYVIGKTGMGKSTLLENMAGQDIQNGEGMAFIDPHGTAAEKLLEYVPEHRIKDVIYFAPFDLEHPVSFNVMEDIGKDQRYLVANGLMASFKKVWPDVWSARMEYILNNILLALLEYPDSTLLGVNRMLSDKDFRNKVVANITDPSVRAFWVDEFAKYTEKLMTEAGASIQNKIGQFASNPLIRNIIGQPKSTIDIRKIMDEKKILIMNLSKGRIGEINANLLGGMLITKIYLAAMSRASASAAELRALPDFYFYVDEFQSFVNDTFKDILSEARKYKLCLTIAHQYIEQMPEEVRNAVFGNVGTTIAFRVGPFDAEVLEKIFAPQFEAPDIVNLGFAQIYLTLMIDGVGSAPFSAKTLGPIPFPDVTYKERILEFSRNTYARPVAEVDAGIRKWHEPVAPPPRPRELGPSRMQDDRALPAGDSRPPRRPDDRARFGARDQGPPPRQDRPPRGSRPAGDMLEPRPRQETPVRRLDPIQSPPPPVSLDSLKPKERPPERGRQVLRDALLAAMNDAKGEMKAKETPRELADQPVVILPPKQNQQAPSRPRTEPPKNNEDSVTSVSAEELAKMLEVGPN